MKMQKKKEKWPAPSSKFLKMARGPKSLATPAITELNRSFEAFVSPCFDAFFFTEQAVVELFKVAHHGQTVRQKVLVGHHHVEGARPFQQGRVHAAVGLDAEVIGHHLQTRKNTKANRPNRAL